MHALRLILIPAVVIAFLTAGCDGASGKKETELTQRAGITAAIRKNRGLCCRVGTAQVKRVQVTDDNRYAKAGVSGGNDVQGVQAVLWHGTNSWAVVDYGTEGCEGYGYLPRSALRELFERELRTNCLRVSENSPRKKLSSALKNDPFVVDLYINETVAKIIVIPPHEHVSRYAVAKIDLRRPNGDKREVFVLARKGTQLWAAIDVKAKTEDLGCGIIPISLRQRLGFPDSCRTS